MQQTITVPGIGLVTITKKTNATRIKLRVHPQKGVLVTIPYFVKFKEGERFVNQNLSWLHEKLSAVSSKKELRLFTEDSAFRTRTLSLEFFTHDKDGIKALLKANKIIFFYNLSTTDFSDDSVQSFIVSFILKCLKNEGEIYLKQRLENISAKIGIKYHSFKVGTAGTRLGSCSSRNDVILSCRLMLLPDDLIDYVIVHELTHIIHKNHSVKFHSLLNQLVDGKSAELNKRLKKNKISVEPGDYSYM